MATPIHSSRRCEVTQNSRMSLGSSTGDWTYRHLFAPPPRMNTLETMVRDLSTQEMATPRFELAPEVYTSRSASECHDSDVDTSRKTEPSRLLLKPVYVIPPHVKYQTRVRRSELCRSSFVSAKHEDDRHKEGKAETKKENNDEMLRNRKGHSIPALSSSSYAAAPHLIGRDENLEKTEPALSLQKQRDAIDKNVPHHEEEKEMEHRTASIGVQVHPPEVHMESSCSVTESSSLQYTGASNEAKLGGEKANSEELVAEKRMVIPTSLDINVKKEKEAGKTISKDKKDGEYGGRHDPSTGCPSPADQNSVSPEPISSVTSDSGDAVTPHEVFLTPKSNDVESLAGTLATLTCVGLKEKEKEAQKVPGEDAKSGEQDKNRQDSSTSSLAAADQNSVPLAWTFSTAIHYGHLVKNMADRAKQKRNVEADPTTNIFKALPPGEYVDDTDRKKEEKEEREKAYHTKDVRDDHQAAHARCPLPADQNPVPSLHDAGIPAENNTNEADFVADIIATATFMDANDNDGEENKKKKAEEKGQKAHHTKDVKDDEENDSHASVSDCLSQTNLNQTGTVKSDSGDESPDEGHAVVKTRDVKLVGAGRLTKPTTLGTNEIDAKQKEEGEKIDNPDIEDNAEEGEWHNSPLSCSSQIKQSVLDKADPAEIIQEADVLVDRILTPTYLRTKNKDTRPEKKNGQAEERECGSKDMKPDAGIDHSAFVSCFSLGDHNSLNLEPPSPATSDPSDVFSDQGYNNAQKTTDSEWEPESLVMPTISPSGIKKNDDDDNTRKQNGIESQKAGGKGNEEDAGGKDGNRHDPSTGCPSPAGHEFSVRIDPTSSSATSDSGDAVTPHEVLLSAKTVDEVHSGLGTAGIVVMPNVRENDNRTQKKEKEGEDRESDPSDVNEGEQMIRPAVMSCLPSGGKNVVVLEPDDSSLATGASSVDADPHEACSIEKTNDVDEVGVISLGRVRVPVSTNENDTERKEEKERWENPDLKVNSMVTHTPVSTDDEKDAEPKEKEKAKKADGEEVVMHEEGEHRTPPIGRLSSTGHDAVVGCIAAPASLGTDGKDTELKEKQGEEKSEGGNHMQDDKNDAKHKEEEEGGKGRSEDVKSDEDGTHQASATGCLSPADQNMVNMGHTTSARGNPDYDKTSNTEGTCEAELGVDSIATPTSLSADENWAKKEDENQEEKKVDEEEICVDEDESDRHAFSTGCDSLAEQKTPVNIEPAVTAERDSANIKDIAKAVVRSITLAPRMSNVNREIDEKVEEGEEEVNIDEIEAEACDDGDLDSLSEDCLSKTEKMPMSSMQPAVVAAHDSPNDKDSNDASSNNEMENIDESTKVIVRGITLASKVRGVHEEIEEEVEEGNRNVDVRDEVQAGDDNDEGDLDSLSVGCPSQATQRMNDVDSTIPFEGGETRYDDGVPELGVDSIEVQISTILKSCSSGEKDDEEKETRGEKEGDVKDIREEEADLFHSFISSGDPRTHDANIGKTDAFFSFLSTQSQTDVKSAANSVSNASSTSESHGADSLEAHCTDSLEAYCTDLLEAHGGEMSSELELGLECILRPISPESDRTRQDEKRENVEGIDRDIHEEGSSSHSSSLGFSRHEADDNMALTSESRDYLTNDSIGTDSRDESHETDGSSKLEPESGSEGVVLRRPISLRAAMMERVNKERETQGKQVVVEHIESHEGEEESSKQSSSIDSSSQADESILHGHSLGSISSDSHGSHSLEAHGGLEFSNERQSEEQHGADRSSERQSGSDCIARMVSMRLKDYEIKKKESSEEGSGEDKKEEVRYRGEDQAGDDNDEGDLDSLSVGCPSQAARRMNDVDSTDPSERGKTMYDDGGPELAVDSIEHREDVKDEVTHHHWEQGSRSSSSSSSSPNGSSSQGGPLESSNGMASSEHTISEFMKRNESYDIDNIPGIPLNGSLTEDMIDITIPTSARRHYMSEKNKTVEHKPKEKERDVEEQDMQGATGSPIEGHTIQDIEERDQGDHHLAAAGNLSTSWPSVQGSTIVLDDDTAGKESAHKNVGRTLVTEEELQEHWSEGEGPREEDMEKTMKKVAGLIQRKLEKTETTCDEATKTKGTAKGRSLLRKTTLENVVLKKHREDSMRTIRDDGGSSQTLPREFRKRAVSDITDSMGVKDAVTLFENNVRSRNQPECSTDTAGDLWTKLILRTNGIDFDDYRRSVSQSELK